MSERIIGHMNKDHQLALIDYLVVYGNVELSTIVQPSVAISKVDEKTLVIDYKSTQDSKTHSFSIDWADASEHENVKVTQLSDLKDKLVAMAKYAADKQGFSHKQIKKVLYPSAISSPMYLAFIVLFLNAYDPYILRNLFGKDAIFQKIIPYLPAFATNLYGLFESNAAKIAIVLGLVHLTEVTFFTLPQTRKYRVPFPQRIQWILMHLFEGFFVILRFKSLTK
ncbi:uncharacterized protein RJT20DRAFT_135212 [Scheffersomyces xylosifermentans]|uniref:uncharacterized protein n=1 Tax=Scheffersomyces xylosifermentans TaxID=1304137 RepID=UPI00315DF92F